MGESPMIPLLKYQASPVNSHENAENEVHTTCTESLEELFERAKEEDYSPEATEHLLYAILSAEVGSAFHKINIHAAMTLEDVKKHFEPVFSQAEYFLQYGKRKPEDTLTVTVRTEKAIVIELISKLYLTMFRFSWMR